jgi:hypothetical protein
MSVSSDDRTPAVNLFLSHISEEQADALKAKEHLEKVFGKLVNVFAASSWTSIAPGQDWFDCVSGAIEKADVMLVFCSGDSVNRPWIQFETGAGWFAKKTKVVPVCYKGMSPTALPEPIRRLQAVDINAESEAAQLQKLAAAVRLAAGLPEPPPVPAESIMSQPTSSSGAKATSVRAWFTRPAAHVGEELTGVFKVGVVSAADRDRADAAGIDADDAVYVRLFDEPPTGRFLHTMAVGDVAGLLESPDMEGKVVVAKLVLKAPFRAGPPDQTVTPLIMIQSISERKD